MLLNNERVNNEIEEEIKRYLETSENENTPKSMGYRKSSPEREICNITGQHHMTRKISNNLTLQLKKLEKEQSPT